MKFFADLHIHSKFSRATSRTLDFLHLWQWAQIKGLSVVATGDCVHPGWLDEIEETLVPNDSGLLSLSAPLQKSTTPSIPATCRKPVHFVLSTEISCIYKRGGIVRKVHNVVCLPTIASARTFAKKLGAIGNIKSDGRPILGLDSRDLLDIALSCSSDCIFFPAHIWTPWFSVLGSKSGFDSIEECFGDLTKHIYALETGLSSDPLMNWRLSRLDPFLLLSNSDAHSPSKLGREANIFDTDLSYMSMLNALKNPKDKGFAGTIEFFPEEGKYHYDGHRDCKARLHPRDTIKNKGLCPVCNKPVTVGVMSRVEELADRPEGSKGKRWRPYTSAIPLVEIVADSLGVGTASKKVTTLYNDLIDKLGSEFSVLLDVPIAEISKACGERIAQGISNMRKGKVALAAGYDGEFGTISLFDRG